MKERKKSGSGGLRKAVDSRVYGRVPPSSAVPFRKVLRDELRLMAAKREGGRKRLIGGAGTEVARALDEAEDAHPSRAGTTEQERDEAVNRQALDASLTGLAFSGGGIRSAIFNLGVVQALADLKLLSRFDYLSTVSGGGYIGSWLTALIDRENRSEPPEDPAEPHGVFRVEERLATDGTGAQSAEDPAITFLRQYSNYLTPRVGLLSADTWSVIATYLRNLTLNLVLLIPGLAVLLLVPRLASVVHTITPGDRFPWLYPVLGLALSTLATVVMGYSFASYAEVEVGDEDRRAIRWLHQGRIQAFLVVPLLIAAFLSSHWLAAFSGPRVGPWVFYTGIAYAFSWSLAFVVAKRSRWGASQSPDQWLLLVLLAAVTGGVCGILLRLVAKILAMLSPWHLQAWGTPLLVLWFILVGVVHTGLMGRDMRDRQREWLNRLGAWLWIYAIGWAAVFALILYGPVAVFSMKGGFQAAAASGWVIATLGGLIAGRAGDVVPGRLRRYMVSAAPYVFIVGLLAILSVGIDYALARIGAGEEAWRAFRHVAADSLLERFRELDRDHLALLEVTSARNVEVLWLAGCMLVIGGLLAWRIDVNEFSMHRLYRNRLVRCFLGASVPRTERQRRRQPFTGFYRGDDLLLRHTLLRDNRDGLLVTERGPYPLINTAINLAAGEELAWQQRKASSFVLSPMYCGFDPHEVDFDPALHPGVDQHGYRMTQHYGSHPSPLTMGSALAISGAAASPNMGFRTTPAFAFLLTIFNVRLGWWLGNPRHRRTWGRSGPIFAWLHLFREIFGATRGRTGYVYLSDGGHFENLGLYELVRRRCRFVVVCDAGADPAMRFDDLGNAIRKCRSDLGVEIDIQLDQVRPEKDGDRSAWHGAVGTIRYGGGSRSEQGLLLYVKASLTGDEPEDVRNYAAENPEFPHQSTADQFFDEAQFESYRRLGHHVAMSLLQRAARSATDEVEVRDAHGATRSVSVVEMESMWLALEQRWQAPVQVPADAFTHHAEVLDTLFERLRTTDELAFLDTQICPEWRRFLEPETPPPAFEATSLWLPTSPEERRHGFYFCSSLLQLMENVYRDLDLDHQYDHPDHRGWSNLFRHWSWSGMFRVTWAIAASTYGRRFQTFCDLRLGLGLGLADATALPLPAGHQGAIAPDVFHAAVEAAGARFFNFVERGHIAEGLARDRHVTQIVQLELIVEGGAVDDRPPAELLRFGFGYALLDAHDRFRLFRVQDHLRAMGLGRAAIRRIRSGRPTPLSIRAPERSAHSRFEAEHESGRARFFGLVASVERELEEERSRTQLAHDMPADESFSTL